VIIFEECFNIGIQFCIGVDNKLFVVIFLMELYSELFSRPFLRGIRPHDVVIFEECFIIFMH
jgi:hypothetical protein